LEVKITEINNNIIIIIQGCSQRSSDYSIAQALSPILALEVRRTAMMRPKRPMALPKISTMSILTKSAGLAASERAAPEPT
jgi:hypothetical protein